MKKTTDLLTLLFNDLKNLVPPNFADLYTHDRIKHLARFTACLRIRAQRLADNPLKEEKKIMQLEKYSRHLPAFLSSLSMHSTPEKSSCVEEFFWLLEEYKISLFAPELRTMVKVSEKKLDTFLVKISTMI
jgi:ATP-dependent helicase HrpA